MKRKDILILLIPSFIIVILWVIFNVYHNYVTSTIEAPLNTQILFISPNFDMATIDKLKQREAVIPVYSTQSAQVEIPQVPETPTSSQSGETATPGGEL